MPKGTRAQTAHRRSVSRVDSISPIEASTTQRSAAIWTASDDEILASARASGLNWQPIATQYFPNKTANACRKRHERLTERRNQDGWEAEKLEALAVAFMEHRREIWSILAEPLGERWSVIEAKVLEKGLKNLQSIARSSHKRRDSMIINTPHHLRGANAPEPDNHEGDSGLGLSDVELEPAPYHQEQNRPPTPLLPPLPSIIPQRQLLPSIKSRHSLLHHVEPQPHVSAPSQQQQPDQQQQQQQQQHHPNPHRVPPPPLPLYRPPLAALANQRQRNAAACIEQQRPLSAPCVSTPVVFQSHSRTHSGAPIGPGNRGPGMPNGNAEVAAATAVYGVRRGHGVSVQSMLIPI